jgi:uncharacterized protein involved in cysteine biosynthesis
MRVVLGIATEAHDGSGTICSREYFDYMERKRTAWARRLSYLSSKNAYCLLMTLVVALRVTVSSVDLEKMP